VILDAPPFQGFADVLVLSKMVDGVILVSVLGYTPKDALKQFKKSLTHIQANLLGSIVNKVPLHSREGGYRYRYKYYHYNYEQESQNPDSEHARQLKVLASGTGIRIFNGRANRFFFGQPDLKKPGENETIS
jgi:Mrp family chromosome partitioning ATPase